MKKMLLSLMAVVAVLTFSACNNNQSTSQTNNQANTQADTQAQKGNELDALQPLGDSPEVSQWYKLDFDGAVNGNGSHWLGAFKKGSANKVLFVFFGGGVSVDTNTAAYGLSACKDPREIWYFDNIARMRTITSAEASLASQNEDNPFKDWSYVLLPYTTGDFHCGNNDFEYTGKDGQKKILHHHGYLHFQMTMNKVAPLLGNPEALVITGFSAGGWGASMLAEDVIGTFPNTKNVTVCIDSSCIKSPELRVVAKDVWKAPEHILKKLTSDFIILDCFKALHHNRPDVKILFGSSTYDASMTESQTYFDNNGVKRMPDREAMDAFHKYLKEFTEGFRAEIPEGGLFIWNDFVADEKLGLTVHTIEFSEQIFSNLGGHGSFIKWMGDAVNGEVHTYGLDLL